MKVVKITDAKWKVTLMMEDILDMGFRPELLLEDKEYLFKMIRLVFQRMQEDYNVVLAENVGCEVVRERDVLVLVLTKAVIRTPEELLEMVSEQASPMEPLNPIHFEDFEDKGKTPYSLLSEDWEEDTGDSTLDEIDLFNEIEADSHQSMQHRMQELLDEEESSSGNIEPKKKTTKRNSPLSKRKAGSLGEQMMLLIETHDFEHLLALVKQLNTMGIVDSSVYSYKGKYVLWLSDLNMTKGEWQNLKAISLEYMSMSFESSVMLQEYGKALIKKDAVSELMKTFHKED